MLHQRWLFAESENFLLYDFYRPDGSVDEDVFAYSNRRGEHRALVIYHNRFATTYGTIHVSANYADKAAGHLRQQSLGGAFGLPNDDNLFPRFSRPHDRDLSIWAAPRRSLTSGYSVELQAYKCHVYLLNWRELRPDDQHRWDLLCDSLNGRGVFRRLKMHCSLSNWVRSMTSLGCPAAHRACWPNFPSLSPMTCPPVEQEGTSTSATEAQFMQTIETRSAHASAAEALAIYSRKTATPIARRRDRPIWSAVCPLVHAAHSFGQSREAEFAEPWSLEAKMVLPSSSPEDPHQPDLGTRDLAYCVLQGLAQIVAGTKGHGRNRASTCLIGSGCGNLWLARFSGGGEISQEGWRAAARLRITFLGLNSDPGQGQQSLRLIPSLVSPARSGTMKMPAGCSTFMNRPEIGISIRNCISRLIWWVQLPESAAARHFGSQYW